MRNASASEMERKESISCKKGRDRASREAESKATKAFAGEREIERGRITGDRVTRDRASPPRGALLGCSGVSCYGIVSSCCLCPHCASLLPNLYMCPHSALISTLLAQLVKDSHRFLQTTHWSLHTKNIVEVAICLHLTTSTFSQKVTTSKQ